MSALVWVSAGEGSGCDETTVDEFKFNVGRYGGCVRVWLNGDRYIRFNSLCTPMDQGQDPGARARAICESTEFIAALREYVAKRQACETAEEAIRALVKEKGNPR